MKDLGDHTGLAMPWKIATGLVVLIALGTGAMAYVQFQRAETDASLLATSQSELTATKEQLATSQGELTATKEQLTTVHDQAAQLEQLRSQAVAQAAELKQQTVAQNAELRAESRRDLPVLYGFRKALLGGGLVLTLKNSSSATLPVSAQVTDASTGYHKTGDSVIPPNGMLELGRREGWTFAAGQHVTLTNAAFRPWEITVTAR